MTTAAPAARASDWGDSSTTATGGFSDATPSVEIGNDRGDGTGTQRRSGGSLGTWVSAPWGVCGANGETFSNVPGITGENPGDPGFEVVGEWLAWFLYLPDGTQQFRYLQNTCLDEPAPTPPPDVESLLAVAAIPRPPVVTNPATGGLVGLENWFWYEGATEVPVSVSLDGWTATTTARAVGFTWTVDGAAGQTASGPGSPNAPAARHTFTSQGSHAIALTVRWEAVFTMTGFGTTFTSPLGAADLTGPTLAYPVQEREAVIVG